MFVALGLAVLIPLVALLLAVIVVALVLWLCSELVARILSLPSWLMGAGRSASVPGGPVPARDDDGRRNVRVIQPADGPVDHA
jgi:hypothetical protein